jgi:nucleoid-associated protein YgaU
MQPAAADPSEESTQHIPAPRTAEELAPASSPDKSEMPDGSATPDAGAAALTDRERDILAFEAKWWKHAGAKEQAIRDLFGLSSTRYYQVLNALLDKPEATEQDPVLVGRLRRLRATRARTRRR